MIPFYVDYRPRFDSGHSKVCVTPEATSRFPPTASGAPRQFFGPQRRATALRAADPTAANRRAVIATDAAISPASNRPGSVGSISVHLFRSKIHAAVPQSAKKVPQQVSATRCGEDFTVGTTALSKTFTLGIS